MAHCCPLVEVAASAVGVENMDEAVVAAKLAHAFWENLPASNGEKCLASPDAEDTLSEGGSNSGNSRTYYFGPSTITVDKIKEMVEKCYFLEGRTREPGAETVLEPDNDEVMVYEDFFVTGLRMPPHPALADILLHFHAQLHQLRPNAIAQFSKYFWVVWSFGVCPRAMRLRYGMSCIISQRQWKPNGKSNHAIWMPEFSC
jgi:hypothetical protein